MSETPRTDTERDAKLAALYRAASQDGPPPALDDAIRAAARRAVASKPRLASSPFSRSWRVPLSIAAVLVLSVSLVTLMHEEAPQIAQQPRADSPLSQSAADPQPESASEFTTVVPKTLAPDEQKSSSLGLKPSRSSSSSGIGIRRDAESTGSVTPLRKQTAAADRMEARAPAALSPGKQAAPEAFPGATGTRDNKVAASTEQPRQAAKEEAPRAAAPAAYLRQRAAEGGPGSSAEALAQSTAAGVAAQPRAEADRRSADSVAQAPAPLAAKLPIAPQAQPAPAPKPEPVPMAKRAFSPPPATMMEKQAPLAAGAMRAYVNLPPEKWLERIEELRKQGKLEEAKANLEEFRKRYPDYPLPAALKEWAKP